MARPLWKNETQTTVRPIVCSEALVNLAFGVICSNARCQIDLAVGRSQHGAGEPSGAEAELAEFRAAAQARPNIAFGSLDVDNAHGSIKRHHALQGLIAAAPKLAVPLATLLGHGSVSMYTQEAMDD